MSRTRIIKGKYIKTVGENYNISAEGNVFSSAANQVQEKGESNGVSYGSFERLGSNVNDDFEISFSLKKDGMYSTVVPFGILDFEGNYENANFAFNYSLSLSNIDTLEFKILNEDGSTLYAITNLPEVVVTARRLPLLTEDLTNKKPKYDLLNPKNVWDWKSIFDPYNITSSDYTKIGSYIIFWDGFDNNGIYDSVKFNGKKLKAVIIARKNGKEKIKEVEFSTKYEKVDWVDVKIDKNNKRIDTTLRVNLKDGGAEGLNEGNNISPEALVYYNKPVINTQRIKYSDLEKITVDGIARFWSRNSANIGKGVNIFNELHEVNVIAIIDKNGLAAPKIIYQTNTSEGRSRNWELSRILYFYEGYLYRDSWKKYPNSILYKNKGWEYVNADIDDYKMVSAHEIGHEILLTYGGQEYSKSHKNSSTILSQETLDTSPTVPTSGEIDLMKYYQNYYDIPRTVISEFDLLKVIWLTKIKIK